MWLFVCILSFQGFLVVAVGCRPSAREKSWILMRDAERTSHVQPLSSRFMAFLGGILDERSLKGFPHKRILQASLILLQQTIRC